MSDPVELMLGGARNEVPSCFLATALAVYDSYGEQWGANGEAYLRSSESPVDSPPAPPAPPAALSWASLALRI